MSLDLHLDRRSPVPLYYQVAQQIEQAIQDGTLSPGERIDTEVEISERYGLSRPTVRQAIAELVNKGLLVRRRGVGTQVVHAKVNRPDALTSLHDDLLKAGRSPSTRVLTFEVEPVDATVSQALDLPHKARVQHFERLRFDDGSPLAIMRNWIPPEVIELDAQDLAERGLYEIMRSAGINVRIAHQRISACAATPPEARLLGVRSGSPLLTLERTAFDDAGRAVEYARSSYRADAYSFETTLVDR